MLYQLINTFTRTGRKRILAILGFLIALFLVLPLSIFLYGWGFQPYLFWVTVYGPIFYVLLAVSPFFLVYYVIMVSFPDFFSKNKWAIILPVIGFITILAVTLVDIPLGITNILNWSPIHYYGVLLYYTVYILIIPLFAAYHYLRLERIRGTPRVKWILVITLGTVLWFIAGTVGLIPPFTSMPGAMVPAAILGLAWWIIFIGSVLDSRAGRPSTD
jgi:hypothetical protein